MSWGFTILSKVKSEELLSRYILEKTKYRASDMTVKHSAFMPARNGETSVYRINDLNDDNVWNIGRKFVANPQSKPLIGRADIFASNVFKHELTIKPAPAVHLLHANITGWPVESMRIRMIAVELARESQLHLSPDQND